MKTRAAIVLPVVGMALLGLVFALHPTLFSGLGRIQTDHEDPRLINYLLEHGYRWFRGNPLHRDVWSPPFFYPTSNVLAYSDSLLSIGPLYWPWRLAGLEADTSFQLWQMTCFLLNDLLFWVLLRVGFEFRPIPSALGAFLFAFGASRETDIGHPQLLSHFFSILAILAISRLVRAEAACLKAWQRLGLWTLAALSVVAQLYASFYMGWFLILATALTVIWGLILPPTREILLNLLRRDWALIALASILAAIPTSILVGHYLEIARVLGYRSELEVMLAVPRLDSWLYMGPNSWLYHWQTGIPLFMGYGNLEAAHRIGVGWITPFVCFAGLVLGRDRPAVRIIALAGLTLFLLVTRIPRWVLQSIALACWMLAPLAVFELKGHPWRRAVALACFAGLSWLLFPWAALIPVAAILALRPFLGSFITFRQARSLDDLTAFLVCLFPAMTSFTDYPLVLVSATSGAVAVVLLHRRNQKAVDLSAPMLFVPALLAAIALLVVLSDLNLWRLVYNHVPGGAAIRVTSRVCLLMLVPLSIGFTLFWEEFGAKSARRPWLGLTTLAIFCLLEQGMTTPTFDKFEARNRVEAIASKLRTGGVGAGQPFFYSSARPGLPNWNDHVDAMWAGLAAERPTINGYSGQMPPGWKPLYDLAVRDKEGESRVRNALRDWARDTKLDPSRVNWIIDEHLTGHRMRNED